jgi:uncharacterized protein (TIGR03663 family)
MSGENENIELTRPPHGEGSALAPLSSSQQWCAWLVVALALLLRLLWLGMKPPHFDEGVNGWFVDQIAKQGFYHYDPGNYHGPFHFYVLFLAQTLLGRSVEALRLPLVLVNVATVWLVLQYRRFLPWRGCVLAALAFAVSPGMLFYSRYAIHESWMVFGLVLAFWGAAELWARGTTRGLWAATLGVTLLVLTKETYVIHLAAFGLAVVTLGILEKFTPSAPGFPERPVAQQWDGQTLGNVLSVGILAILFFYSGGFLDPSSLHGLMKTFADWFQTGVNSDAHAKPWYYWLLLFVRYEWPALLGLLWSVRALWPGMNRLARLLAIYGCGTLVAYSLVPYKTPWCIISLLWPFFFIWGVALDALKRGTALVAGVILCASLAAAVHLNYLHPVEPGEQIGRITHGLKGFRLPTYVYVQTTNDLFKLTGPLARLTALDPTARHMSAHVLLSSYHPLPWVLGEFTSVGYYDTGLPPVLDAGFIVAEDDRTGPLEAQLKESYFVEPFQLRDGMGGGKLYFNTRQFAQVFPGRAPDFTPHTTTTEPVVQPAIPVEKAGDFSTP